MLDAELSTVSYARTTITSPHHLVYNNLLHLTKYTYDSTNLSFTPHHLPHAHTPTIHKPSPQQEPA